MRRAVVVLAGVVLAALGASAAALAQASIPLSNATPLLEELGRQAQDTSLPDGERLELVRTLGRWGTPQVRAPLVALLADTHPAIRAEAARGLGWAGNHEAVPALHRRLEAGGEPPAVRAAALEALGKIGDHSVRGTVLGAIADPDPRVREAALGAVALGLLATPADRVPLLRALATDRALDPWLRSEAIRELARARDAESVPLLIRLLETEAPMAMSWTRDTPTQQEVMAFRYRQARDVRAWAAAALGQMEAREALPQLLKSAEDTADFFLRFTTMNALVAWQAPEALAVFLRRLDDPFPDVRVLAVTGVARMGHTAAADRIVARLSDPVPTVRVAATAALVDLGHPGARAALEGLRRRELDASVQQAIEAALTRLGS